MPRLLWAMFCQQAIVDQFTNNVSIINQIDELQTQAPPPPPPSIAKVSGGKARALLQMQCALISAWEREKPTISESSELSVDLIGPHREKLAKFTATLDLRKHRRVRQFGNLPGIPLVGEGTYRFVLRCRDGVKWRTAHQITFEIKYADRGKAH